MASMPTKEERCFFRVVFEDGSETVWGWDSSELCGEHMGRFLAEEQEEREAGCQMRDARRVRNVERIAN